MKTIYKLITIALLAEFSISCSEESDLAIERVVSPVVIEIVNVPSEIQATFFELDKSGILDHNIGIDSIPVANLAIEVFAANTSIGVFTTDAAGSISVSYTGTKPNEFAGIHKDIPFRIKK